MLAISTFLIAIPYWYLATGDPSKVKTKVDLWRGANQSSVLRGANIWQKAVFKEHAPFEFDRMETFYGSESFEKLRWGWNGNVVFASHAGIYHPLENNGRYSLTPAVLDNLYRIIHHARRSELFVVIGFRTGPGRAEEVFTDAKARKPIACLFELDDDLKLTDRAISARKGWIEMWRETARQCRSEPSIIGYNLMVEPLTQWERHWPDRPLSLQRSVPGNAYLPNATINRTNRALHECIPREIGARNDRRFKAQIESWRDFAVDMATAIRQHDQSTPILFSPAPYAAAAALDFEWIDERLEKHGPLVYCVHQYTPSEYCEEAKGTSDDAAKKMAEAEVVARITEFRKTGRLVAIGEFGVVRYAGPRPPETPDSFKYVDHQIKEFEKLDCNHALWLWEVERLDYTEFNFRLGINRCNCFYDANDVDPLTATIKSSWRRNVVFATAEVLERIAQNR